MKKRKPDRAGNKAGKASIEAIKQSQALQYLGMLDARSNNPSGAAEYFEQACDLEPDNADLLNNQGYFHQLSANPARALDCYQRSLTLNPKATLTLCNIGLLHKNLGHPAQAIKFFDDALAIDAGDVALICNRANALLDLEQADAALADYDKALKLDANNASVFNGRASVLSELLRYDEALSDLNRAIELKPDYAQAWSNRGDVHRDLDQHDQAIENYQQALTLAPDDAKTLANLAGVYVTRTSNNEASIERITTQTNASLQALLNEEFSDRGAAVGRMLDSGVSAFRLKHDLGQARYLNAHFAQAGIEGLQAFIDTASRVIEPYGEHSAGMIPVTRGELDTMLAYWRQAWQAPTPKLTDCLNPENDWRQLEQQYLDGKPEILTIDNFLSVPALQQLQTYCLASKVWVREYPNQYLGAFANQGFASPLHFQLAAELKTRMPRVFKDYPLNQLWGFKYDTVLGKGINIHADFALVNLNFWITPDQYNLDKSCGGLKVYETPAPPDWTFHDYNTNSQAMYGYLDEHNSSSQIITYRCNRAVLFNSALFHETDRIQFADGYESRRINMTYLFGKQLW